MTIGGKQIGERKSLDMAAQQVYNNEDQLNNSALPMIGQQDEKPKFTPVQGRTGSPYNQIQNRGRERLNQRHHSVRPQPPSNNL